jgi:hypothetical protein
VKCPLSKTSTAVETPDEEPEELSIKMPPPPPDTAWFNAILGRVLFDVLRDHQWSEWVRDRIQRKLSTVKVRTVYFCEKKIYNMIFHSCPISWRS